VLRVLGNLLNLPSAYFDSSQEILAAATAQLAPLSNATSSTSPSQALAARYVPCTASLYQLDGLVRRAPALQLTADARQAEEAVILGVAA
jgi:NADH-quinone oxidoreductase subunit G